jgi:lipid A 3-O-deacylase
MLLTVAAQSAAAESLDRAVVVDVGRSTNDSRWQPEFDVMRLGYRWAFKRTFWQGESARLGGYWEASGNYWSGSGNDIFAVAVSPVFVLTFGEDDGFQPYLEGGIGAALLSDHSMPGRELSTTFQFEDRIGFGVRGARVDFHYRYMHYSNGGIERPNNGLDMHVVGVAIRY